MTDLGGGKWKAEVTRNGRHIANLDSTHSTSRVHGSIYALNQANGFVGVQEPSGWHSESDVARPDVHHHSSPIHHDHGTPVHHDRSTPVHRDQQRGVQPEHRQGPLGQGHKSTGAQHSAKQAGAATRQVTLSNGAIAHITHLRNGQWQAKITMHGKQIAELTNAHRTASADGYTYALNIHTGDIAVRK
ncbi:hypothetical protein [Streptomyces sp. SID14478]|uniref:hypothetical protein n=1 Tax=Streptomyces sp. SID14478 TaxID=2706073 RepID=UPI0013E007CC|nr:hypothetical protein [Streptomyces sp. SID14478]